MLTTVGEVRGLIEGLKDDDFVFADLWIPRHFESHIANLQEYAVDEGWYCENISLAHPTTVHRLMQCVPDAWKEYGEALTEMLMDALVAEFVHRDEDPEP